MDRNFFLAIALSAAVLFVYQGLFVPVKHTSIIENAQNSVQSSPKPPSKPEGLNTEKTTNVLVSSVEKEIKSENYTFSYINVGGSLHKVVFNDSIDFPISNILTLTGSEGSPYSIQKSDKTVTLTYADKNLEITKIFSKVDNNVTKFRMEIKNLSEISILNDLSITAFEIDANSINPNSRENSLLEYSISVNKKIFRKGSAYKFNGKEYKSGIGQINWVGFRNHYNAFVLKPEFEAKEYEIKPNSDKNLSIILKLPGSIDANKELIYEFSLYSGPQDPWVMKKYGDGFEKIVAFSGFPVIEWIAQAIYYIIPIFHSIFKSWGFSIILISILLYALTYPLTMKSMVSMRKMQEVQPKITALREKYKSDPQKLNAEMVEIYRREKINPFGGCLPFLIQMPFFMALYQILWRAQYFQGRGFLWIKDLAYPDRLIILPFNLPLLGNEVNILPVLTGVMMFVQQKISSKNMVVVDEQQAMQQKMMMYMLPLMMMFMFYKFASSWAIYFLVFYILSTITQWKIAKITGKK